MSSAKGRSSRKLTGGSGKGKGGKRPRSESVGDMRKKIQNLSAIDSDNEDDAASGGSSESDHGNKVGKSDLEVIHNGLLKMKRTAEKLQKAALTADVHSDELVIKMDELMESLKDSAEGLNSMSGEVGGHKRMTKKTAERATRLLDFAESMEQYIEKLQDA